MIIKTRIFDLYKMRYRSLLELAKTMRIPISQVCHIREGRREINHQFIIKSIKAFPEYRFNELFYLTTEPSTIIGNGSQSDPVFE